MHWYVKASVLHQPCAWAEAIANLLLRWNNTYSFPCIPLICFHLRTVQGIFIPWICLNNNTDSFPCLPLICFHLRTVQGIFIPWICLNNNTDSFPCLPLICFHLRTVQGIFIPWICLNNNTDSFPCLPLICFSFENCARHILEQWDALNFLGAL